MRSVDYSRLQAAFGPRFFRDEPLAKYTAARLGGPADVLVVARNISDLVLAADFAWTNDLAYRILGGGANVLVADAGFRGLVIVNRAAGIIIRADGAVRAESGVSLSTLARRCMKRGLVGLEWAVSIPGTVGGAAINNAGAHGGDMAGCVHEVVLHRPDGDEILTTAQMAYGYRTSALKGRGGRFVLTEVVLALRPGGDPAALQAQAEAYVAHRKRTQPPGASLGSIFKNPPGDYAGRLIEAAGLKGKRIGGVQISPVHANFFVNLGEGTAADYLALIRLAQETVARQFGIMLEPEIELIGEW